MSVAHDLAIEKYSVGQPVPRGEDPILLRGDGCYTDDVTVEGAAHGYMLRSPYAHGVITRLATERARQEPGVLGIVTSKDLDAAGVGDMPCLNATTIKGRGDAPMVVPSYPPLAKDRVRYLGQPIAFVVAETLTQARDAAEAIELEVDELPAVTDAREALAPGAPQIHEAAPNNQAVDWEFGDPAKIDEIFASAHHVATLTLRDTRIVVSPMEPRACVAIHHPETDSYTLHAPSQGLFGFTNVLAGRLLNIPKERLHVLTHNVGGSFGMKAQPYPEYVAALIGSKLTGRPVRWRDTRTDSFLSDLHGRDAWAEASLAFDAEGRMLGGRVITHANSGAYQGPMGPNPQTANIKNNFPGAYKLPALHARSLVAFTNTTPTGPYRGAGRPEGVYYMERLIDQAARDLGIDPVEIRRRNFLPPDAFPHKAASGLTYDSGDFETVLDKALEAGEWDGFEARRAETAARGRLRGRGLCYYLEVTAPPAKEMGRLRFEEDGTITMVSGNLDYGQGHLTPFAQIVSSRLGIPIDRFRLLQGDSRELVAGSGTGGSRTAISGGTLLYKAAGLVIENGKALAAHVLEAAPGDIEFGEGRFTIAGTDRAVDILDLADRVRTLKANGGIPADLPQGLDAELVEDTPPSSYPNGCHIAEVEIDRDTGVVALVRHVAVNDFGTLINPLLVEGQVHGGVVQGFGQVMMENAVYDEGGQLVSGSYMDYAMPRASDLPNIEFHSHAVPAKTNPLGAKGCGEAGVTGAMPAIMNAIVDVLAREVGVTHIDMPASPEKIWALLNGKA